jgi:hypothetical protein
VSSSLWPREDIPKDHYLYVRVHQSWIKNNRVVPGFFQNRPSEHTGAMSTDWCKYSTPEDTRCRAKKPEMNGVGQLLVSEVEDIPGQIVEHTPLQNDPAIPDNRAHTDVKGPKEDTDLDIQDQFSTVCKLILPVPPKDDP